MDNSGKKNVTVAQALKEILGDDPTILANGENLVKLLDNQYQFTGKQIQDKASIRDALMNFNIGEFLLAAEKENADSEEALKARNEAKEKVREKLQHAGKQENSISRILEIFDEALGWNQKNFETLKAAKNQMGENHEVDEAVSPPSVPVGTASWNCVCGKQGNTGAFCTACGKKREVGEVQNAAVAETTSPQMAQLQENPVQQMRQTQVMPSVQPNLSSNAQSYPKTQPTQSYPQQNYGQPNGNPLNDRKKHILLGAVIVVLLAVLGFAAFKLGMGGNDSSSYNSVAKQDAASEKATRDMVSDLSLGGLDLDCTSDDMKKVCGQEKNAKTVDGMVHHYFEGIEVVTDPGNHDKVCALVSDGADAKTKRGIHEGSTRDEVIKAYGDSSMQSDYQDLRLYEYNFTSMDGKQGILRFAIKKADNTVKYISARLVTDNQQQKKPQADVNGAKGMLMGYYQDITNHNLRSAYNRLSPDMQNHMGAFENFADGYQTTISSVANNLQVVSAEPDRVVISYNLVARDRQRGPVKQQTFVGNATLSNASGRWQIVDMTVKKTGEMELE